MLSKAQASILGSIPAVTRHDEFTGALVVAFFETTLIVPAAEAPPTVIGSVNGAPKEVPLPCICHVSLYELGAEGAAIEEIGKVTLWPEAMADA